jgi:cytochrome c
LREVEDWEFKISVLYLPINRINIHQSGLKFFTYRMRIAIFLLPAVLMVAAAARPEPVRQPGTPSDVQALLTKYACATCHQVDKKMVGPSWKDIARKKYSKKRIIELVYKPEPANWPGYPPMVAQPTVPKADLGKIADWLATL